ncbi:hypothetical protein C0Q70_05019 [Pomacea canaliculata]|uniref:Nucleotide exchange factor Fes1 domain-containing protein n=1 Tax=Pomacea canaliculata TaxID=400727 RepID=A0A2T7PJZ8_POMCA|nr:hypothetical protein C0Q70_05019 [Pomacea canaliculata]
MKRGRARSCKTETLPKSSRPKLELLSLFLLMDSSPMCTHRLDHEYVAREDRLDASCVTTRMCAKKVWLRTNNAYKKREVKEVRWKKARIIKEEKSKSQKTVVAGVSEQKKEYTQAINCLEELRDWCEEIDLAVDFHKIGGFSIFPIVLQHPDSDIRWRGLDLMATLVQNNPYCQVAILQEGFLPQIVTILDKDPDPITRTKALYAISCLVRTYEPAQEEFVKHDGFSILLKAMQSNVEKLKVKASFLLTTMCSSNTKYKDTLCAMGIVEQLLSHLMQDHQQEHEHIMAALLCLVRDHLPTQAQCRRPELNLKGVLQQRIKAVDGKDEHREEFEYAQELLRIISEDGEEEGQR